MLNNLNLPTVPSANSALFTRSIPDSAPPLEPNLPLAPSTRPTPPSAPLLPSSTSLATSNKLGDPLVEQPIVLDYSMADSHAMILTPTVHLPRMMITFAMLPRSQNQFS